MQSITSGYVERRPLLAGAAGIVAGTAASAAALTIGNWVPFPFNTSYHTMGGGEITRSAITVGLITGAAVGGVSAASYGLHRVTHSDAAWVDIAAGAALGSAAMGAWTALGKGTKGDPALLAISIGMGALLGGSIGLLDRMAGSALRGTHHASA